MSEITEIEVLRRIVSELEAEGYEVYAEPNKPLLPLFLGDYRPDAIALRKDKNLVVEVLRQSAHASQKLQHIQALLQGQKNWELRVVWVTSTNNQANLQVQSADSVRSRINEINQIAATGNTGPAMLLGWAIFEALARLIHPNQFERPQTPGRIVQILAGDGYLTPTEADLLRTLTTKRNKLIHGELQVEVSDKELQGFVSVLEEMLQQIPHQR